MNANRPMSSIGASGDSRLRALACCAVLDPAGRARWSRQSLTGTGNLAGRRQRQRTSILRSPATSPADVFAGRPWPLPCRIRKPKRPKTR